ncbi:hypothetical protein GCM10020221_23370 [Streptomyces thioluteus]|uniref:Transposase n=1 Tax=Streptomyces thioluteus TaxID=66431 RepID=A0ABN3WVA1_STRTU
MRHLQTAFTNFFGKRTTKYPRFKSRKEVEAWLRRVHHQWVSASATAGSTLAKMTEPLDIVWSRPLPEGARPSTVTVSRDSAGRWFVSVLCDDPSFVKPLPAADAAVGCGCRLWITCWTLSTGEKVANPRHHERRDRTRLARAQRALSKKARR